MSDHQGCRQLWDSRKSQFCGSCGLYHYRDECDCPYFNDEFNWR
jgi:hypothetical protein